MAWVWHDQLTQDELKRFLHYDPDTGAFVWLIANSRRVKVGAFAGTISKKCGYLVIRIANISYQAHRLAWLYMTGVFPKTGIDHENRCKLDNRWSNLREATKSQNACNTSINNTNSSGYKGVHWDKGRKKWVARIKIDGKTISVGGFLSKEEAARAYNRAALKFHGEFAKLNELLPL